MFKLNENNQVKRKLFSIENWPGLIKDFTHANQAEIHLLKWGLIINAKIPRAKVGTGSHYSLSSFKALSLSHNFTHLILQQKWQSFFLYHVKINSYFCSPCPAINKLILLLTNLIRRNCFTRNLIIQYAIKSTQWHFT